jgi:hypothetical protein
VTKNADITLYISQGEDEEGDTIYERVDIYGVFLETLQGIMTSPKGTDARDNARLFIPFSVQAEAIFKEGDFFVKGITEAGEVKSFQQVKSAYNDVYRITKILKRDFGSADMQHWEILGA